MKSRAVRFLLLTLFVGSLAAAAYVTWNAELQGRSLAAATRLFDDESASASRVLLDLRHAQSGYVAAGQGEEFWAGRVDALFGTARDALTLLQARPATEPGSRALDEASAAFDDFRQMDRRARSYARNGQRLLASDLIFSDGLERIDLALAALHRARHAERLAADAGQREQRQAQLFALGGFAGTGLLVTMLLVPLPGTPARGGADAAVRTQALVASGADAEDSLPLRIAPPVDPPPPPAPTVPLPLAPAPATAAVDLPGIASLCTDLARVGDMQALPAALARAAALLRATGIIVWVSDPDGRELSPVMAHGYPPQLLARIGTIGRDDENVTAAAFRTGLVQIVRGGDGMNGAVAAPLVAPTGTAGVMAAELTGGDVEGEVVRSASVIIAAQLSTLLGPPASRNAAGAGGV